MAVPPAKLLHEPQHGVKPDQELWLERYPRLLLQQLWDESIKGYEEMSVSSCQGGNNAGGRGKQKEANRNGKQKWQTEMANAQQNGQNG